MYCTHYAEVQIIRYRLQRITGSEAVVEGQTIDIRQVALCSVDGTLLSWGLIDGGWGDGLREPKEAYLGLKTEKGESLTDGGGAMEVICNL